MTLPDSARLWVYAADRDLTSAEAATITEQLNAFVAQWAAHGQPLRAAAAVAHNRFVLLAVDETQALPSGCSIDASVGVLRQLEHTLGVGLLHQGRVLGRRPDGSHFSLTTGALRAAVETGELSPTTPVYDVLTPTLGAWRATNGLRAAAETWLRRYFSAGINAR